MKNSQKGFAVGTIIAIVAVVALGGAGTWYVVSNNAEVATEVESTSEAGNETGKETTTEAQASASTSVSLSADVSTTVSTNINSVEAALAAGGSYTCTFDIKDANTESRGTYYISDKKIRGDFTSVNKVYSQSVQSHTIIDEKFSYTWTDLSPTMGFKVPVVQNGKSSIPAAASGQLNLNGATSNYTCTPWKADTSKFTIPASVTFMETPSAI